MGFMKIFGGGDVSAVETSSIESFWKTGAGFQREPFGAEENQANKRKFG
jgi:hypothetical protein